MRDDEGLVVDEEGLELGNIQAVQEEAERSLSDMARDTVRVSAGPPAGALTEMSIEVRDDAGPVMHVRFTFEIDRKPGPPLGRNLSSCQAMLRKPSGAACIGNLSGCDSLPAGESRSRNR
jgi:uncharacterized protein DUF6894